MTTASVRWPTWAGTAAPVRAAAGGRSDRALSARMLRPPWLGGGSALGRASLESRGCCRTPWLAAPRWLRPLCRGAPALRVTPDGRRRAGRWPEALRRAWGGRRAPPREQFRLLPRRRPGLCPPLPCPRLMLRPLPSLPQRTPPLRAAPPLPAPLLPLSSLALLSRSPLRLPLPPLPEEEEVSAQMRGLLGHHGCQASEPRSSCWRRLPLAAAVHPQR